MFHGYGSSAVGHESYLHLRDLADEKTFLYAYPDGLKDVVGLQFWNATDACCDLYGKTVDDVAFAAAIIADVSGAYAVDPKRVWLFGHSNGGFMAHRLACDLSSQLSAVVSLAGMTWNDASKCGSPQRLALLQIHGTADQTISYDGGRVAAPWMAPYPSAHETVAHWAAIDGCGAIVQTGETEPVAADFTTTVERYENCAGGAVELWSVQGGPHEPNLAAGWYEPVWAFVAAHPRP
jgi:polyhydroxybutyrate depolymerase